MLRAYVADLGHPVLLFPNSISKQHCRHVTRTLQDSWWPCPMGTPDLEPTEVCNIFKHQFWNEPLKVQPHIKAPTVAKLNNEQRVVGT